MKAPVVTLIQYQNVESFKYYSQQAKRTVLVFAEEQTHHEVQMPGILYYCNKMLRKV